MACTLITLATGLVFIIFCFLAGGGWAPELVPGLGES